MSRGMQPHPQVIGDRSGGTAWASAVAILFAIVAATSFAIDMTISLSAPSHLQQTISPLGR